ncbi:hypothetical protein VNO80_09878 [Phaseolus coccineus]|uniref:Uncharacterized protein n=1 Tax=Phaseolus coccineus TaxID=3886 RepID=A0AAN9N722_PHACN
MCNTLSFLLGLDAMSITVMEILIQCVTGCNSKSFLSDQTPLIFWEHKKVLKPWMARKLSVMVSIPEPIITFTPAPMLLEKNHNPN